MQVGIATPVGQRGEIQTDMGTTAGQSGEILWELS